MTTRVVQRALRRSLTQIRYVSAVRPGAADGLVAAVYAQVERDFGMLAPPVALHSPAPGPLAACWAMLRETLLAHGLASRAAKEVVAAAVSLGNTCPYCVTVHSAVLGALASRREAAAIAAGRIDAVTDSTLAGLAAWARSSGRREAARSHAAPFPPRQLAELAGVAVAFQYLNRMVTVFLAESPLPAGVPTGAASGLLRVLGSSLRPAALSAAKPGAALALLAPAPVPGDLRWAAGNPAVADAFARASAAVEAAGMHAAPGPVRELVVGELAGWDGQPRGLGRSWADDAVSRLAAADRPPGLLALLTAIAPHQVTPADIGACRRRDFADRELIELTSWASLTAARRVGTWLGEAGRPAPGAPPSAPGGSAQ